MTLQVVRELVTLGVSVHQLRALLVIVAALVVVAALFGAYQLATWAEETHNRQNRKHIGGTDGAR